MLFKLHHEILLKLYYASFSYATLFLVNLFNSPVILRTLSPSSSSTYFTMSPYGDLVAYTYLSFHLTNLLYAHFFIKLISFTFRKGFYKHEVFFINSFLNNLIFHNLLAIILPLLFLKLGLIGLPTNNDSSILLTELITWVKLLIYFFYFLIILSILLTLNIKLGSIRITRTIYVASTLFLFSASSPPSFIFGPSAFAVILFMEIRIIVTLINSKLDENNLKLKDEN